VVGTPPRTVSASLERLTHCWTGDATAICWFHLLLAKPATIADGIAGGDLIGNTAAHTSGATGEGGGAVISKDERSAAETASSVEPAAFPIKSNNCSCIIGDIVDGEAGIPRHESVRIGMNNDRWTSTSSDSSETDSRPSSDSQSTGMVIRRPLHSLGFDGFDDEPSVCSRKIAENIACDSGDVVEGQTGIPRNESVRSRMNDSGWASSSS
jgi:hypothetical protein